MESSQEKNPTNSPKLPRTLAGRLLLAILGLFVLLDLIGTVSASYLAARELKAENAQDLVTDNSYRATALRQDLERAKTILRLYGVSMTGGLPATANVKVYPFRAFRLSRPGQRMLQLGQPGPLDIVLSTPAAGGQLTGYIDPTTLLLPVEANRILMLLAATPDHRILGLSLNFPNAIGQRPRPPLLTAVSHHFSGTLRYHSRLGWTQAAYFRLPGSGLYLVTLERQDASLAAVRLVIWDLVLTGLGGLVFMVVLVLAIARRLQRPWIRLLDTLARLEAGQLEARVPETGSWEERVIAGMVNRSLTAVSESQEITRVLKEAYALLSADLTAEEALSAIARLAAEITGASHSFILIPDTAGNLQAGGLYGAIPEAARDLRRLSPEFLGDSSSPAAQALQSGEPLLFPGRVLLPEPWLELLNRLGITAGIFCPLRYGEENLGVITLWTPGHPFTQREIDLAEEFARTAAVVVKRTHIYDEIREQRRELELLYGFSQRLAEMGDEEALLTTVLKIAADSLGFQNSFLALKSGDYYRVVRTRGHTERFFRRRAKRLPLRGPFQWPEGGSELAGAVLAGDDLKRWVASWPTAKRFAARHGFRGLGLFPLTVAQENLGLLVLPSPEPLDPVTQRLATNLARESGLALANLRQRQRLENWAIRDPLTGLYNRRFLESSIESELARTGRSGGSFCLVLLDLDNFKRLNDTRGHQEGDRALAQVGRALLGASRAGDVVARLGGDEFALLLPDTDRAQALEIVPRLVRALPLADFDLGISAGIAAFPVDGDSYARLYRAADEALYRSKAQGKGRVN